MNTLKRPSTPSRKYQQGVTLIVSLVLMMLTTIIGVTGMQSATMQEKMASNYQDHQSALQAADSAAHHAWELLNSSAADYGLDDFVSSSGGLYDLRTAGNVDEWVNIRSAADWPWADTSKRKVMSHTIGTATDLAYMDSSAEANPMALAAAPQFAIGMYDITLRTGSENYKCIPYGIIGASQGASDSSLVLVEIKVIPKSSCFPVTVK